MGAAEGSCERVGLVRDDDQVDMVGQEAIAHEG
jgi:hypothetical protein